LTNTVADSSERPPCPDKKTLEKLKVEEDRGAAIVTLS
jgi:hypothetical protein